MRFLFLLSSVLLTAACTSSGGPANISPQRDIDASAYQECDTLCVRPSDCQTAFNDDGTCPPGYLCAFRYTCVSDGSAGG